MVRESFRRLRKVRGYSGKIKAKDYQLIPHIHRGLSKHTLYQKDSKTKWENMGYEYHKKFSSECKEHMSYILKGFW